MQKTRYSLHSFHLLFICCGVLEPAGSSGTTKMLHVEDGLGKGHEILAQKHRCLKGIKGIKEQWVGKWEINALERYLYVKNQCGMACSYPAEGDLV